MFVYESGFWWNEIAEPARESGRNGNSFIGVNSSAVEVKNIQRGDRDEP